MEHLGIMNKIAWMIVSFGPPLFPTVYRESSLDSLSSQVNTRSLSKFRVSPSDKSIQNKIGDKNEMRVWAEKETLKGGLRC
jgi:hypothetical protein